MIPFGCRACGYSPCGVHPFQARGMRAVRSQRFSKRTFIQCGAIYAPPAACERKVTEKVSRQEGTLSEECRNLRQAALGPRRTLVASILTGQRPRGERHRTVVKRHAAVQRRYQTNTVYRRLRVNACGTPIMMSHTVHRFVRDVFSGVLVAAHAVTHA